LVSIERVDPALEELESGAGREEERLMGPVELGDAGLMKIPMLSSNWKRMSCSKSQNIKFD
jgi:hypothetical protein